MASAVGPSFVPRTIVFLTFIPVLTFVFFSALGVPPPPSVHRLFVSYSHHGWVIVLAPFDAMSPHYYALHLTNNNLPVGSSPSLLLSAAAAADRPAVRVVYPTNLCPVIVIVTIHPQAPLCLPFHSFVRSSPCDAIHKYRLRSQFVVCTRLWSVHLLLYV